MLPSPAERCRRRLHRLERADEICASAAPVHVPCVPLTHSTHDRWQYGRWYRNTTTDLRHSGRRSRHLAQSCAESSERDRWLHGDRPKRTHATCPPPQSQQENNRARNARPDYSEMDTRARRRGEQCGSPSFAKCAKDGHRALCRLKKRKSSRLLINQDCTQKHPLLVHLRTNPGMQRIAELLVEMRGVALGA